MQGQEQRAGYVRSGHIFLNTQWSFEVESEELTVAVLIGETPDGPVHFGMNRNAAERLRQTLGLFLERLGDVKPS